MIKLLLLLTALFSLSAETFASKLIFLKVVDKDYIQLYFKDGDVIFDETKSGSAANEVVPFGEKLDIANASKTSSWTITSSDDNNYASETTPTTVYRKSKLGCMSQEDWNTPNNDFDYEWAYDHYLFLKLPNGLQQNKSYSLKINSATKSDSLQCDFVYDIYSSKTEAIKVNITGYSDTQGAKNADLYFWLGDGGARDYSTFEGKKVYLYNITTKTSTEVGTVKFYAEEAAETASNHKMILSKVWGADFSSTTTSGTYRIAIEDIGCSEDFEISSEVYHDPFQISVLGYYYMRIGEAADANSPSPRQPQYIPEKSPTTCKVYVTDMSPLHDDWNTFFNGDKWDGKLEWKKYVKEGSPTNPNAYGGHSDAKDWDRHLGHVSNIYDMLLPYFLTNGAIDEDDLHIAESGNGIPDIIDEARNEVDFWLRLRYQGGYSHGLNNPTTGNVFYQADNTPMAAWANAANAAMIAACFEISGHEDLMIAYRDSAINAFNYATNLPDPMLTERQEIGSGSMTANDFRMTAAAYLYNITGNTKYEDIVKEVSKAKSTTSTIVSGSSNQLYATAAYLGTRQKVNYQDLYDNMKASIIAEAKKKEADYSYTRPSRRASDDNIGWFVTEMGIQRTIVAHRFADSEVDKSYLKNALINEYDWTLGRNPLNMIQMTTATTNLASKRSVENAYTSGWDDGTPGVHPGHTPYFNIYDWWQGMVMGMPSYMTSKCYPAAFDASVENMDHSPDKLQWPQGELYFNTRYVYCANEFTPRQTMRGKMALYGYLYGDSKPPRTTTLNDLNRLGDKKSSLFPNPSKTFFNVMSKGKFKITILDTDGNKVYENRSESTLKVGENLTPGIYFWTIESEENEEKGIFTKL